MVCAARYYTAVLYKLSLIALTLFIIMKTNKNIVCNLFLERHISQTIAFLFSIENWKRDIKALRLYQNNGNKFFSLIIKLV